MPKRLCQDCPAIHNGPGTRCPGCQQRHDQARPSRQARGYDRGHELARERLIAQWVPGQRCPICGKPTAGDPRGLDLAHNQDRTGYLGLAHQVCNRGHHDK